MVEVLSFPFGPQCVLVAESLNFGCANDRTARTHMDSDCMLACNTGQTGFPQTTRCPSFLTGGILTKPINSQEQNYFCDARAFSLLVGNKQSDKLLVSNAGDSQCLCKQL